METTAMPVDVMAQTSFSLVSRSAYSMTVNTHSVVMQRFWDIKARLQIRQLSLPAPGQPFT